MNNPESIGSRTSYSGINGCTNLPNLRFSKKTRGLETSENSKKTTNAYTAHSVLYGMER
jgi:hypothetical protein